MESGLLEDWLQRAAFTYSTASWSSSSSTSRSSSPSAQQIAQAWSQIRECVQNGVLQPQHSAALRFLRECGRTIHMVEPQARLLLSIISSVTCPKGVEQSVLAHGRSSAASLLSIWLRRGLTSAAGGRASRASSTHSADIVQAVVTNTLKTLESSSQMGFVSDAILLLGTVCVNPNVQEDQRRICQEAIVRECVRQRNCINGASCKEALAGVGYAMAFSSGRTQKALLQALLCLWAEDEGMDDKGGVPTTRLSLENGLLLLHLMEWYASFLASQQQDAAASLQLVVDEIVEASTAVSARCAVMMSAAGLLRSFHLRRLATTESTESSLGRMVQSLNLMISRMVDDTAQSQVVKIRETIQETTLVDAAIVENENFITAGQSGDKQWFQCVALAISRCAGFPPSLSVLVCLITTLLDDVLPLGAYYEGTMCQASGQHGDALAVHVGSILFHEAGAIFRVICEQYQSADKGWQGRIENLFSQYSHLIYLRHRYFLAKMDNRTNDTVVSPLSANDTAARKLFEAVLLSVVMLFSLASKQRIDTDMYAKGQFAAQVMHSLSCIEFIRQGQVREYRELVQRCVAWASASEATCAMLVSMFPSYDKIIHPPGPALSSYNWMKDDVQDSRVLFGFRVLPSCLHTFPAASFSNEVAPTMFLYMKHPNPALVQASHSLLVSFLSTKSKDAERYSESERDVIKEQLAVGFTERTFEEVQVLSHYDIFVTVVGAIARQLPAGSKATKGCITTLSRRASELFSCASECNDKGQENKLETGKKLQTLLLHLILIVDVQVLPHLLQEVARLVLGQANPHRMYALEEAFDILAGSDDLTRKHILVPWLQSLSYLCSNFQEEGGSPPKRPSRNRKIRSRNGFNNEVGQGDGVVAFNPSSATMFVESEADDTSQVVTSRL